MAVVCHGPSTLVEAHVGRDRTRSSRPMIEQFAPSAPERLGIG